MASGCRSYLRSSAYETGDRGWMGGGCGRKCAAEAAYDDHHTIRQIHTARKGRVRGRGVGLGARIYLGVQTAADRERTARGWRRRGSAVLGLVGGRRRGLEETLAAPPWGVVGGWWGLSRGGRMRGSSGFGPRQRPTAWARRNPGRAAVARGVSSAAVGTYRAEADARRSLWIGSWSEGGGDGVRKERGGTPPAQRR